MKQPVLALAAGSVLLGLCAGPAPARAAPSPTTFWGVNDSGMEFGHGNKAGTNYAVPDPGYYLRLGLTLIRLPVRIDRLAPVPGGPLDPTLVAAIRSIVDTDRKAGAITVIDPHGYGFVDKNNAPRDILRDPQARADYVAMMGRLATAFGGEGVAIDLMNEPHTGPDQDYAPIWNEAIAAMRKAGFHGTVLVPHAHWSAARDIAPATPFAGRIDDPDRRWVLELHSYLDADGTGTYRTRVVSPDDGAARLAGAIAWSRQTGIRIFLGETGAPPDPAGVAAFGRLLDAVQAAPDVFWGIAVWGAGPWWKPNYPMRLDPIDGVARPQIAAMTDRLSPQSIFLARDADGPDQAVAVSVDGRPVPGPVAVVSAVRTGAPQALPLRLKLAPGVHRVRIVPRDGGPLYLLGADWKGASDATDAFGAIGRAGREIRILVPAGP